MLDAASRLFAQRGVDATSMDAIAAERSGVSKATIYKHWPDKEALCLEVLARLHGRDRAAADEDSGDVQADILAVLTYEPPAEFADLRMRMMPHLMAYAARNPAFGKAWRATVFDPPQLQLRMILDRAVTRGALPRTLDRDVAVALLLGPDDVPRTCRRRCCVLRLPAWRRRRSASFWKAFGAPGTASGAGPCPACTPRQPRPRRRPRAASRAAKVAPLARLARAAERREPHRPCGPGASLASAPVPSKLFSRNAKASCSPSAVVA